MKKYIAIIVCVILIASYVWAERAHVGDSLTTSDLPGHILGTTNQITVTPGADNVTLSTPQNLDTGANVTFNQATLGGANTFGVPYFNSSKVLSTDTGFVYNATTDRLGIGLASGVQPRAKLEIYNASSHAGVLIETGTASAFYNYQPYNKNQIGWAHGNPLTAVTDLFSMSNTGRFLIRYGNADFSTLTTSGQNVLFINGGTAPTNGVANIASFYAKDCTAGNTCPTFKTENGTEIQLDQTLKSTDSPKFAKLGFNQNPRAGRLIDAKYTAAGDSIWLETQGSGYHAVVNTTGLAAANDTTGYLAWRGNPTSATLLGMLTFNGSTYNQSWGSTARCTLCTEIQSVGVIDFWTVLNTGGRKWRIDTSGNLIGSNTAGFTSMINSMSFMPGDLGSGTPSGVAAIGAEKVTTSAGVTKSMVRVRNELGAETTIGDLYGEIKFYNEATPVTFAGLGTTYTILNGTATGWNTGISPVGFTASTNTGLTALNAGVYEIKFDIGAKHGSAGANTHYAIAVNGTVQTGNNRIICETDNPATSDKHSCTAHGRLSLNANDKVAVFANSTSSGTLTLENFYLGVENH